MSRNWNQIGRRAFLKNGTLLLAATNLRPDHLLAQANSRVAPAVRAGLITDLHYADKPQAGTRYYRETLTKLAAAAREFQQHQLDFVVELGDLIDAADSVDTELAYLKRVDTQLQQLASQRHYVLGNHCVHTLTKSVFLKAVGRDKSYYSFDVGGFHFVILDACFRADGAPYGNQNFEWTDTNIPEKELRWLQTDLAKTTHPSIVLVHQRLDVSNHYGVKNGAAVRKVLEGGNVLAVFQGHSHQNDLNEIAGIHYCTLTAMVEGSGAENNGYSVLSIQADGSIELTGFEKQANYAWPSSGDPDRS